MSGFRNRFIQTMYIAAPATIEEQQFLAIIEANAFSDLAKFILRQRIFAFSFHAQSTIFFLRPLHHNH